MIMATYYNVWREKSPQNFTFHRVLRIRAAQNVAFIIGPNFSLVSIRVLNVEDGREIPKLSGAFSVEHPSLPFLSVLAHSFSVSPGLKQFLMWDGINTRSQGTQFITHQTSSAPELQYSGPKHCLLDLSLCQLLVEIIITKCLLKAT